MKRWSIIALGSREPRVGAGTDQAQLGLGSVGHGEEKQQAFLHRLCGSALTGAPPASGHPAPPALTARPPRAAGSPPEWPTARLSVV
jgi:hypothetical protein